MDPAAKGDDAESMRGRHSLRARELAGVGVTHRGGLCGRQATLADAIEDNDGP